MLEYEEPARWYSLSLKIARRLPASFKQRALGQKYYSHSLFSRENGKIRLDSRWLIGALATEGATAGRTPLL